METFEFTILMIVAIYGLFAIVAWVDDDSMHKAEHDDVFHEHAH